jgi:chromosomal replication initiator protein
MDSLWTCVRRSLEQKLTADEFSHWIEPLKSHLDSGHLVLLVPSRFHYDWIREHYLSLIKSCCRALDSSVRVHLQNPSNRTKPARVSPSGVGKHPLKTDFRPSQTFATYILAPFNRFAAVAAQALSEDGSTRFNPLYIEGPPGNGKTHLLHAIGNALCARSERAAYLNCRDLLFQRSGPPVLRSEPFWEYLVSIRVLLTDDVHLVLAEERCQHTLVDVFDWCYDNSIGLVFAANRLPHQIPEFVPSLRSRLGWGVIARIRELDLADCQQLIKGFVDAADLPPSPDLFRFLAEQGPVNLHDVKDCVRKLRKTVQKQGGGPNSGQKPHTTDQASAAQTTPLSIQSIQRELCESYGLSREAVNGAAKSRPVAMARQVGMYLSRKLTNSTYAAIGAAFGGRDHSTVMHACRKVRREMRRNRALSEKILDIERNVLERYREKI